MTKKAKNTFEDRVKSLVGSAQYQKLPKTEKATIKEFSRYQEKTKAIYSNGSMKFYESLGVI